MKLLLLLVLSAVCVAVTHGRTAWRNNKWDDSDGSDDMTTTTTTTTTTEVPLGGWWNSEEDEERNRHASYSFRTDIDDAIKDGVIQREETRDGLQVSGSYTYSDGYYRRTISYIADEDGYRVVNEIVVPIGNGPMEDKNGRADVQTSAHGYNSQYTVHGKDINLRKDLKQKMMDDQWNDEE